MPQLYSIAFPEVIAASHALTAVATARVGVFVGYQGFLNAKIRVVSKCAAASCLVNVLRLRDVAGILQLLVSLEGARSRASEVGFAEQVLAGNVV